MVKTMIGLNVTVTDRQIDFRQQVYVSINRPFSICFQITDGNRPCSSDTDDSSKKLDTVQFDKIEIVFVSSQWAQLLVYFAL